MTHREQVAIALGEPLAEISDREAAQYELIDGGARLKETPDD